MLLSKARFVFIAAFREWFHHICYAELRGRDEQEFAVLGCVSTTFRYSFRRCRSPHRYRNENLIAELMPAYPIYISLLPDDAREVIGQVHANTAPARAILEKEGLLARSVDIDAGPVLEAETDNIRAIRAALPAATHDAAGDANHRRQRTV